MGVKLNLIVISMGISLMTNDLEHLFMCFLAIYIFEERSIQIFTQFSN